MAIVRLAQKLSSSPFWKKLLENAATAFVGTTGANIIELLSLALVVRLMGVTGYAFLVLAQQYMTIIDGLINFQSWQAIIKFGADAQVHNDERRLFADIKAGFIIDGVTAAVGMILAL
ncbi:MAG: hypothetical protein IJ111_11865, partial [Eggerthellaceae bacterium]|nr:hypothetical protein [Eggerthellaceae bacterium]